ncbi:MAG: DUF1761 domain-containing protein [Propionibacteriaceae bacterium]|jgi:hypothetical protein|nr:DUF1761 domain-containing protein [Propionibacteriaceae bacterium]
MFYIAAAIGALVSFVLGCLWYTILFGKQWQKYMGYSDEEAKAIFAPKRILSAVLCEWFAAACLTGILFNLPMSPWIGAVMASVFVIFTCAKQGIFDGKRPALILINSGYLLLSVAIIATSVFLFLR